MAYEYINQELSEPDDLDVSTPNTSDEKVAVGTESFVDRYKPKAGSLDAKLTYGGNKPEDKTNPGTRLIVRTTDNKVFRIYFCANTIIDSPYFQNRFCLFMDSLQEGQVVILEMGTGLNGSMPDTQLGMMIDSICNCKAKVITLAAGRCGFAESCLFIYGKDKVISPYGALLFTGIKSYNDSAPMYEAYFQQIFKDALREEVIDQDGYDALISTGKFVMRTEKEQLIP